LQPGGDEPAGHSHPYPACPETVQGLQRVPTLHDFFSVAVQEEFEQVVVLQDDPTGHLEG